MEGVQITALQVPLREQRWHPPMSGRPPSERTRLRRRARWWDLEAMRGYVGVVDEYGMNSSDRSKMYAANQRWLVELLDAGHRVVNVRFDQLVTRHAGMTWDAFIRWHAHRICGERYLNPKRRRT